MTRVLNLLMYVTLSLLLAACGGGGGSAGTPSGSANPANFAVNSPAELAILVGQKVSYQITGGLAPYAVNVSSPNVVKAEVVGSALELTALSVGSASISVSPTGGGNVVTLSVAVATSVAPLRLVSPASVTLNLDAVAQYAIAGGVKPYRVLVSAPAVVSAALAFSGTAVDLKGLSAGGADVYVYDSSVEGSVVKLSVTVPAASVQKLFTTAPDSVTLNVGQSLNFLVSGGVTPYSQPISSNASSASVSINGPVVTVRADKVGTSDVKVTDRQGEFVTVKVAVVSDAPATDVPADPQLRSGSLRDSSGNVTNSVGTSGFTTLRVQLTDPSGSPLVNQLIEVSDASTPTKLKFPEGNSALTGADGFASVKIQRESLNASGAGALVVTFSYKVGSLISYPGGGKPPTADKIISTYVGYQLSTANVALTEFAIEFSSIAAYQTKAISVRALVNGAIPSSPVQVFFSTTCGVISPTSISTNTNGIAVVSFIANDAAGTAQSTQGCGGKTVEITATTTGAVPVSKVISVDVAPATSILFVDASPARIYLLNSGGVTQSLLRFKLINNRNEPLLGQKVKLKLKTVNDPTGLPKATFDTVGNLNDVEKETDSSGLVSVPVFSGNVPTNVIVNAASVSNTTIQTDSAVLTIASGRPAQARVSLSLEKFAIEGWSFDGDESAVTMSLADRQGNPVPDGTAVNFVTSGGVMIPPTCTTGVVPGDSRCTVRIRSQNPRELLASGRTSKTGYVEIMAYTAGEEDFTDSNFNNVYDITESYVDLPPAFRDDNKNNNYDAGEFSVPRTGASLTVGTTGRGDNSWGVADVRQQKTIVFSTSSAVIKKTDISSTSIEYTIEDDNGNSMPTGSTVKVIAVDGTPNNNNSCAVVAGSEVKLPNNLGVYSGRASMVNCATGDSISVEIETPATKTVTRVAFAI